MSTTRILPPLPLRTVGDEIADLAFELFNTTFGLTLDEAFTQARELYSWLSGYAAGWDANAAREQRRVCTIVVVSDGTSA